MKRVIFLLLAGAGFLLYSCDDSISSDDCEYVECLSLYPTEGTLSVRVNFDIDNMSVPIRIYSGYYGEGELIQEDTLYAYSDKVKDFYLPPGVYYSVAADYQTDHGKVVVVDGGKIEVETRDCDSSCYVVVDASVNCKLHYD